MAIAFSLIHSGAIPTAGASPMSSPPPRSGPLHGRFAEQIAVFPAGDRSAAGLHKEHIVLQELAHQVFMAGVLSRARVVATNVGDHAADPSGHDGVI